MSIDNLNFIPQKVLIGRRSETKNSLVYITYKDSKGVLRKEKSWNDWRNKKLEPVEISNNLRKGFKLESTEQRSRDWFGTGRNVWNIIHPDGYTFQISSNNLDALIDLTGIHKGGNIQGSCILVWRKADLILVPEDSDLYRESVEASKRITSVITNNATVNPGSVVILKDGSQAVYLGKFKALLPAEKRSRTSQSYYGDDTWTTEFNWVDRDFVYIKNDKYSKFQYKYKFDIAQVVEYGDLNKEQALDLIKKFHQESFSEKYVPSEMKNLYSIAIETSKVTVGYEEVQKKAMDRNGYYGYGMTGRVISRFYNEPATTEEEVTIMDNKIRVWRNRGSNYNRYGNRQYPEKLLKLFITVGEEKIYV